MKKQVHYTLLADMKKYVKDFNPNEYEESKGKTDISVITYLRNYYNQNLPIDVAAWVRVNEPSPNSPYAEFLTDQTRFICINLYEMLMEHSKVWNANPPLVIATYRLCTLVLPVYQLNLPKYNLILTLRCNLYNWKVSIQSSKSLDFDYMDLFDPKEVIQDFAEDFPKDKLFGSYQQNHYCFTTKLRSNYHLFTLIFLIKNYLENNSN